MFNMWLVNPNDISCEIKLVETLMNLVSRFCWLATVPPRKVVLKFLILSYHHQASCFVLHHVEHTLSSCVVPVNEEVNVVEPVSEEEQSPVEVGFDICGIDPEPQISIDQGKPRMHTTSPCVLKSLHHLCLCFVALGDRR
jgi:hypothetical protein